MPDVLYTREQALAWMASGTRRFEEVARSLDPTEVTAPTRLAGWHRGHVLTHVARNADALRNLLVWARTGVETPMYATPEQRSRDIEAGAVRPAADIVDDLLHSDAALADAITSLRLTPGTQRCAPPSGGRSRRPTWPGCACGRYGSTRST
ncbi:MAG: maleylpyruvate isomerase N-terminal domain-containing protein [Frankiaceae bacterium]